MNPVTHFLQTRRSVLINMLSDKPVPEADIDQILDCGLRVPDHCVLGPWKIIVIKGESANALGHDVLAPEFKRLHPDASDESLAIEAKRFCRAGVVLAVISSPVDHPKIPKWEMQLSAGALCQNLLSGALSLDYGAQWVTEWYAYNARLLAALGGNPDNDQFAGFIYIGYKTATPKPRRRPDKNDIVYYYNHTDYIN